MLRSIMVLPLLLAAAPPEPTPQAIIDYDRPPPRFGGVATETHFVRGDAIPIDQQINPAGTQVTNLRQIYLQPGQPFTFETTRSADGQLIGARIAEDPHSAPPATALRQSTGPAETHVGETCRPWKVDQKTLDKKSFVQSGCTTVDGIELWRKQADINAIYATVVRRTPVSREAVRLPFEALDTRQLIRREAGSDHRSDYEVLLTDLSGGTELHRRSGNWVYIEDSAGGERIISVRNLATGVELNYFRDKNGKRRSSWSRPYRPANRPGAKPDNAASPGFRQQTILGEKCSWRDGWPPLIVFDASRSDCRTADGILLASSRTNWGSMRRLTATRLSRRKQPVSAVMLPAEPTDRTASDVPDSPPVR